MREKKKNKPQTNQKPKPKKRNGLWFKTEVQFLSNVFSSAASKLQKETLGFQPQGGLKLR